MPKTANSESQTAEHKPCPWPCQTNTNGYSKQTQATKLRKLLFKHRPHRDTSFFVFRVPWPVNISFVNFLQIQRQNCVSQKKEKRHTVWWYSRSNTCRWIQSLHVQNLKCARRPSYHLICSTTLQITKPSTGVTGSLVARNLVTKTMLAWQQNK